MFNTQMTFIVWGKKYEIFKETSENRVEIRKSEQKQLKETIYFLKLSILLHFHIIN